MEIDGFLQLKVINNNYNQINNQRNRKITNNNNNIEIETIVTTNITELTYNIQKVLLLCNNINIVSNNNNYKNNLNENILIGDNLEILLYKTISLLNNQWFLDSSLTSYNNYYYKQLINGNNNINNYQKNSFKILKIHKFHPKLQRMSIIFNELIGNNNKNNNNRNININNNKYQIICKGSPESIFKCLDKSIRNNKMFKVSKLLLF